MNPNESTGYLINHMARQFSILLAEQLKPLGLSPAQFPILLQLWQQDGLSQRELVKLADLKQATIANTLARMQRDGLIEYETHADDARIRLIKLTKKAQSIQAAASEIAKKINQQALSTLSETERAQFLVMAEKIIAQQKNMMG